jgi:hypothetical protein
LIDPGCARIPFHAYLGRWMIGIQNDVNAIHPSHHVAVAGCSML